jgi:putative hydrolase of the HAD superfamily
VPAREGAALVERVVYRGLAPYFDQVRPFPGALDTVRAFKAAGLKIGILSDFPPEQKGSLWGLTPLCDAILGSEALGALKPSPVPFLRLIEALDTDPARILYVGNSLRSDIRGAKQVGMQTAWLTSRRGFGEHNPCPADFCFTRYGQLREFVL